MPKSRKILGPGSWLYACGLLFLLIGFTLACVPGAVIRKVGGPPTWNEIALATRLNNYSGVLTLLGMAFCFWPTIRRFSSGLLVFWVVVFFAGTVLNLLAYEFLAAPDSPEFIESAEMYIRTSEYAQILQGGGALMFVVWLVRAILLAQRRRSKGWCVHCGYDLRASPDVCPECGTAAQGA